MNLNNEYQQDDLLKFLEEDFLSDFKKDVRPVNISGLSSIKKASYLGESKNLDLQVFEFLFEGSPNKRVALTKDAFSVMRSSAIFKALAIFYSPNSKDWRFSLMTATPESTEKGKVSLTYSNPKRLSFFLGPNAKINTPTKFLISKGKITDFDDLKNRFSIEVVNKEFYKEISGLFTKLVSGLLKLPSTEEKSQASLEFAVRLIGRIIFCWFLREKKSESGTSLMPKELVSIEAVKNNPDYYHKILEPIFFEVLNKPLKLRITDFTKEPFSTVPYLNGGLFSPQEDDFYKRMNGDLQSQYHNTLVIPDNWLKDFFEILETYNFTIDENTSYDEELSIDPEMLGRIFENLLAEINPETEDSARKNTGSYYTPREVVNYMVDQSLISYLKEQTYINEDKLRAIISYDLNDDSENPINLEEKEKIIEALEKIKILDPACGSGAFPIGALQKIVFILQQADPDGQLWFKKQVQNTAPEVRRIIEREFEHKNFDYIRKLGIIRENIYGADIQPIATEISRLRCFLTIVVDERIQDKEENRGIEPLPNLDFKFVTANSLVSLPKTDQSQQGLFDDYQKIDELKNIRDQYFTASGIEREQLKTEFSEKQNELITELITKHDYIGYAKADLSRKLTNWKPFKHSSTDWFDPEWMFGIKEGFDIVIANPPYVFGGNKGISEDEKKFFKKTYFSGTKKVNLFAIFLEKGVTLLKTNGFLTYILPNTLLRVTSYSNIREYLVNRSRIIEIADLDVGIFENVTASTIILSLLNTKTDLLNAIRIKRGIFKKDTNYLSQNNFVNKGYIFNIFSTKENREIIDKIKRKSIPLGTLAKNIRFGVVITKNINDVVGSEKINENWKPFLEGNEIGKYSINYKNRYLLYEKELLHRSRTPDIFETNKIIIQRITGGDYPIKAALDEDNFYNKESIINLILEKRSIDEYKFILALLNSTLINWFYKNEYTNESKLTVNLSKEYLSEIPIKNDTEIKQKLIEIVNQILTLTTSVDYFNNTSKKEQVKSYEKQIDQMVYKLYGLTPEEIKIIEGKDK